MKSVFFRRLLIVMVMVMMLTTIAMALGCGVVGIKYTRTSHWRR